jgi:hypothetical protein
MATYTPQQIREAYLKLPKDLQEAVFSEWAGNVLQAIGKKYNLSPDKISNLANLTGLVMFGLSPAKDFIINIAREVYIDKETARKIADDINAQIFSKIRESLRKIHGTLGEETISPPPVSQPVKITTPASPPSPTPIKPPPPSSPPPPPSPAGPVKISETIDREKILKEIEKIEDAEIRPEQQKYPKQDPYREPL